MREPLETDIDRERGRGDTDHVDLTKKHLSYMTLTACVCELLAEWRLATGRPTTETQSSAQSDETVSPETATTDRAAPTTVS